MKKEFIQLKSVQGSREYIIEEDIPEVGWYLKVYESGSCIADHLQNDLETIIRQAEDQYLVSPNSWVKIKIIDDAS